MAKKAAKQAVGEARGRAYEDLYQRLGTQEGERDIYKISKIRERKTRDIVLGNVVISRGESVIYIPL